MIRNWKKVTLTGALLTSWQVILLIAYDMPAQAGSQRASFNVLNPDASLGGTNGFGGAFIGGTGSYVAGPGAYGGGGAPGAYGGGGNMGGGPNLGNAVNPATLARYFNGLQSLQNLPAIPTNSSRVTPAQQQQLSVLYGSLADMEMAQYEILSFFGRTHITLNATLGKLAYALGRPRPSYGANSPIVTAFGLTGVGSAGGAGADVAAARKTLLQLGSTNNQTLYNMDKKELTKYQDILSEVIAAPVPPVGVSIESATAQFARVQRAIAKDPLMSSYGASYDLPASASTEANANYQQLLVITSRWNVGQSAIAKLTNIMNTAASDRRALVAAKGTPLPALVKNQVELAISQIDAAQLGALNREVEGVDFEQQLAAFKKSLVFKAQNIRGNAAVKTVDVSWLVDKMESYGDLIGKISARAQLKDVDPDLIQGLVAITQRSKENLAKLQKYKDIFAKVASTPVKRINLALQADAEKVFVVLTPLITTANILKDPKFSSYETILKQVLASPENIPDSITIIQVRKMYKDLQKAKGIILFQQLRTYQKKVEDLAVDMVALSETKIGQMLAPSENDFADSATFKPSKYALAAAGKSPQAKEEVAAAEKAAKEAAAVAGKALGEAKKSNPANPAAVKEAEANLQKARDALRVYVNLDEKSAGQAASAAPSKMTAETKKKMESLSGVMEGMDQLAQLVLSGAFADPATFGNVNISEDQVRTLIKRMNKSLVDIEYKDAVELNTSIATEAQSAVKRLQDMLKAVDSGDGKVLPPKMMMADLKSIRLSLLYDVAIDVSQGTRNNLAPKVNDVLLIQLMNGEFGDLSKKFDEKIQNTVAALSALDTLSQLVEVEDAQGEARQKAKDLIDRITAYLDKK